MTTFTLGIWRQIRFDKQLHYIKQSSIAESDWLVDSSPTNNLYEQIFSWSPIDDIWGGIQNDELREDLRRHFLDTFRYDKHPSIRSISALSSFVTRLAASQEQSNSLVDTATTVTSGPTAGTNIRIIASLAFLRHLQWIIDSYRDTPGISIMVR